MKRAFLLDRIPFIFVFLFNTGLIVLTASLAFQNTGGVLDVGTILYCFVLSLFFLGVWLCMDYVRMRSYLRKLHALSTEAQPPLETSYELEALAPPTKESAMWLRLQRMYHELYREEREAYQAASEQHQLFINQWVHHMKTPVSVISLLVQQRRNEADAEEKKTLNEISDENDRFRHGLELMLHLARLDHFSLDLKAEEIDPISLVRDVVNEEKRQFIRRKLFPEINADMGAYIVASDGKWLRVILHQLLLNALNYSKQGKSAKIFFDVWEESDRVRLSVTDTGIGIPARDLPRVFHPFFTGDNGRTHTESTGMGLYLAHTIASQLGHSIYVDSEVDKGTTVTIVFSSTTLHEQPR
ncbi:sensor histidine kinase [Shouchella shacheensis]|uniref:sensor histidine kinase n=1 Tax=Shouchella shacheensis TaxID=1649580 RepID=UPI0007401C9E|nr:sensor histidine kinase [Shouchella shacheensis]